jgi:hypothetical protein
VVDHDQTFLDPLLKLISISNRVTGPEKEVQKSCLLLDAQNKYCLNIPLITDGAVYRSHLQ